MFFVFVLTETSTRVTVRDDHVKVQPSNSVFSVPSTSGFTIPKLNKQRRERRNSGESSVTLDSLMPGDSASQKGDLDPVYGLSGSPPRGPTSPDISDEETEESREERAARLQRLG